MSKSVFLSLKETTNMIHTLGRTNTILVEGPPGVGKSSILKSLPDSQFVKAYIDAANLDLGDLAMPVVNRETMETNYAINARFRIAEAVRLGKPVALMLDELGKASKAVLNMLLPVLLEKRIGDVYLPEGSIVFATTNLATDGVGDNIPAHARNRITTIHCYGPSAADWIDWGADNGVDPVVLAWVHENPQALDCYAYSTSGVKAENNPYIFNPQKGVTKTFTSHRSLHHAGHIVAARHQLSSAFQSALAGTVGASAAADMMAFVAADDSMARWEDILNNPMTAKLPEGIAVFVQALKCASRLEPENLGPVTQYVQRWSQDEGKALFMTTLVRRGDKISLVSQSKILSEFAQRFVNYVKGA